MRRRRSRPSTFAFTRNRSPQGWESRRAEQIRHCLLLLRGRALPTRSGCTPGQVVLNHFSICQPLSHPDAAASICPLLSLPSTSCPHGLPEVQAPRDCPALRYVGRLHVSHHSRNAPKHQPERPAFVSFDALTCKHTHTRRQHRLRHLGFRVSAHTHILQACMHGI